MARDPFHEKSTNPFAGDSATALDAYDTYENIRRNGGARGSDAPPGTVFEDGSVSYGRRSGGGRGMVMAEDGSMVPASYWDGTSQAIEW